MALKISIRILSLILLSLLFTAVSCNKPTEPTTGNVTITVEDASCTEVWLAVNTGNISLPGNFVLYENNTHKTEITLTKRDTVIVIENLLPKQNYSYKLMNSNNVSNETLAITLDTTSHNFTWQTFEFGQHSTSILYDVAIIDENNIWAVGVIYMKDSNGNPDLIAYNAVHWNGNEWELKRITVLYKGNIITPTLYSVFAFSPTDIWFSSGVPIKGDGTNWTQYHLFDMGILSQQDGYLTKVWGSSSNDIYYVGTLGTIVHWNGTSWKKIESPIGTSGTDLTLLDIQANGRGEIFVCGLNMATIDGIILKSEDGINFNILVEGDNITAEQLFNPKLHGTIASISVDNSNTLYAAGNLVYQYKFNKWDYLNSLPENYIGGNPGTFYRGYITKIRAIASNNIWLAGDRNTVRHFNGLSWQQIGMPYNPQMDLIWRGIDSRSSLTAIAGSHNNNAIIMIIK